MIPESTLQRLETAPTMMHCSVVEMRELVRVYRASISEGSRAGWVCPETYMLTLEAVQTEAKRVAELSAEVERLRAYGDACAKAEREACAKLCDAMVDRSLSEIPCADHNGNSSYDLGVRRGLVAATNAIRARAAMNSGSEKKHTGPCWRNSHSDCGC